MDSVDFGMYCVFLTLTIVVAGIIAFYFSNNKSELEICMSKYKDYDYCQRYDVKEE